MIDKNRERFIRNQILKAQEGVVKNNTGCLNILGQTIYGIAATVFLTFLYGWSFYLHWNWFMVEWGLNPISLLQGWGAILTYGALSIAGRVATASLQARIDSLKSLDFSQTVGLHIIWVIIVIVSTALSWVIHSVWF